MELLIKKRIIDTAAYLNKIIFSQSGFIPGDLCVTQLLSIAHEFYRSLIATQREIIKGFFLYISKAFDKV